MTTKNEKGRKVNSIGQVADDILMLFFNTGSRVSALEHQKVKNIVEEYTRQEIQKAVEGEREEIIKEIGLHEEEWMNDTSAYAHGLKTGMEIAARIITNRKSK